MIYFHPLGGGYCVGLLVTWRYIYIGGSGDDDRLNGGRQLYDRVISHALSVVKR